MSRRTLILWTCGPVQDFIAAARKGRDLWFGSWLLSEVASAAAQAFLKAGGELLLPAPADADQLARPDFDVPNRVLVEVATDDPAGLAEHASQRARARLEALAKDTFDYLEQRQGSEPLFDREEAEEQIRDLLETSWAAVPASGAPSRDRSRVEALLSARKTARVFEAPAYAQAGVPKSSIDAQREAVTRGGMGMRLGLTHDERLCGVGLLKRLGHHVAGDAPGGRVTSVSTFALHTWLRPALGLDGEHREAVTETVRAFGAELKASGLFENLEQPPVPLLGPVDGHLFYRSRLSEFLPDANGLEDAQAVHAGALARFVRTVEQASGVRLSTTPTPYYAILLGDGDQLGRYLEPLDHDALRDVSRALSSFAHAARNEIFDETGLAGTCIYAGGDDVLAFVPVDRALDRARALSDRFAEALAPVHSKRSVPDDAPTFSVGIAIVHHLTPLRDALDAARAAERSAKDDAGRDAWAVRMLMRSGVPIEVHGKWPDRSDRRLHQLADLSASTGDALSLPADSIEGATDEERIDRLPRGLAHDLADAARALGPGLPELERCELQRVLAQKGLKSKQHRELLFDQLGRSVDLRGLADRLVVARALAGMGGAA